MVRWLAIANPHAGALRNSAFRDRWMPQIEHAVAQVVYTREPREATSLAQKAGEFDGIAVVGGDGTVHEVLAGIDRTRQRLAVVPAGRGNSLARELGVSSIPVAIRTLSAGELAAIDLMQYELSLASGATVPGYAASTLALGYAVSAVQRAARFTPFGHYAYLASTPFTCPERFGIEIAYGSAPAERRRVTGVVINNTSWLGNLLAFPQARPADGRLDVMELDAGWLRQNVHNLSVATRRRFYEPSRIASADTVRIVLAQPSTLLIDGELLDSVTDLQVRCVSQALLCQWAETR
jgi:diacylglycerol kinase family enzyme